MVALAVRLTKNLSGVGFAECDLGLAWREPPALVVGKHGQLAGVRPLGRSVCAPIVLGVGVRLRVTFLVTLIGT